MVMQMMMQVVMHQMDILIGRRQDRVIDMIDIRPTGRNRRSNIQLPIQVVLRVHQLIAAGQIVVQWATGPGSGSGLGRRAGRLSVVIGYRVAISSYLDQQAVEELQGDNGNDQQDYGDTYADIDEHSHVAVEDGEQGLRHIVHDIHQNGKVGEVITGARGMGVICCGYSATVT